jgi:single-strand DNA-binding protein
MNKVILIGRVTKDPELKFIPGNGMAICKFTLAVNRPSKDKQADFINCVAFDKRAETIAQYVAKGHLFAVTGSIKNGSYEANDGTKRYTTDIIVDGFDFIQSKKDSKPPDTKDQVGFGDFNPNDYQPDEVPF